jgi:hypothetical protein
MTDNLAKLGAFPQQDHDSMWFCPKCETWVGSKLDKCVTEQHSKPLFPVLADDFESSPPAWEVTLEDRLLAKVRRVLE